MSRSKKPSEGPKVTITAQQSRFHLEATEDSGLREIVVKDLAISIGNRELLSRAEFQLQPGRHYVLIGRNGSGKSTLLQAIASGEIPSIPRSVRVRLLDQIQSSTDDFGTASKDETVLEHVVRSDKDRERLLSESQRLTAATSNANEPTVAVRAYREIVHERRELDLSNARHMATKLSGVRGAKARNVALDLEAEVEEMLARTQALDVDQSSAPVESTDFTEDYQKALELAVDVQSRLELVHASSTEATVKQVLFGLGFSAETIDKPVRQLSGGWKTRCSLASALWQAADVLLLDEPTNFLDLPSIIWLEGYIQSISDTTVVVVTHDRAFADNIGDELLVLRNLKLERFRGTLSAYEVERIKTFKYRSNMKEAVEKQKKHIQSSIDNNLKAAKRKGDDKKLKQVASRQKKLDERMGMEVSAKGTRFKLNRDLPGHHTALRAEIDVPTFDPPPRIAIPTSPPELRSVGALINFEGVTFGYGKRDAPILKEINLTIHPGDRVGLAGLNGSGKSTLVALAMGDSPGDSKPALSPRNGIITRHPRARIGYYSQRAVEELSTFASLNPEVAALRHLMDHCGDLAEKDARALLSGLGLQGKTVEVSLSLLSGGQKVRLALAKLLVPPPHLLILDEVTTHLDSDTIQALAFALRRYEGALLIVTHDRFFMRCVVERESPKAMLDQDGNDDDEDSTDSEEDSAEPGVVYRLAKGKLMKLDGGMQQYEARATKLSSRMGNKPGQS